jgi:hypothetical protein
MLVQGLSLGPPDRESFNYRYPFLPACHYLAFNSKPS